MNSNETKWKKAAGNLTGRFSGDAQYLLLVALRSPQSPTIYLRFRTRRAAVEAYNRIDRGAVSGGRLFRRTEKGPEVSQYVCVLTTCENVWYLAPEEESEPGEKWPLWKSYALAGAITAALICVTYFARFVKGF